ncbi:MAG: phospholipase, partial [Cytophagaceae bacterium]
RVNHSKFMTIDSKIAWIGTSNWSGGYLDSSRNLEIVLRAPSMATRLNEIHEQLWAAPYTHAVELMKEYPKPVKDGA